jgi:hypothetical protein
MAVELLYIVWLAKNPAVLSPFLPVPHPSQPLSALITGA